MVAQRSTTPVPDDPTRVHAGGGVVAQPSTTPVPDYPTRVNAVSGVVAQPSAVPVSVDPTRVHAVADDVDDQSAAQTNDGQHETSVTQGGGKLVTLRGLEDVSKLPVQSKVPVRSHVK
jgi:hypothetical protein